MSPRQVVAALTRRPADDGPDELETWVGDLRPTTPGGVRSSLDITDQLDAEAVRALADTREEQR